MLVIVSQEDILKHLVLSLTQRILVYCHSDIKKPENIKKLKSLNKMSDYPNSC